MENTVQGKSNNLLIFAGLLLILLTLMGYLGGMPQGVDSLVFFGGIAGMMLAVLAVGALAWHLLFRPLPAGHKLILASPLSTGLRYSLALLLVLLNILQSVAGVWDEAWHNTYGVPFGEDFLWRPHIFLYISMLGVVAIGGLSAFLLITRGKGTLQQRFRSDPILGILAFTGLAQILAILTDPVWHGVYGTDLTALSLPHVLVVILGSFVAVVAIGTCTTALPQSDWKGIHKLDIRLLPAVLITVLVGMGTLTVATIDWSLLHLLDPILDKAHVMARPDWALPLLMGTVISFLGMLLNHSLRIYGAATLTALGMWIIREISVRAVGYDVGFTATYTLVLPAALLLDVTYAVLHRRQGKIDWVWGALACAIGTIAVFPLYNQWLVYPHVSLENMLLMAAAGFMGAFFGGKLGSMVGDYVHELPRGEAMDSAWQSRLRIAAPLTTIAVIAFTVWYILTATPPTL